MPADSDRGSRRFGAITGQGADDCRQLTFNDLARVFIRGLRTATISFDEHAQPVIDPKRVFVLGHSLGAKLIPGIGTADPTIAGLIVLAGGARPLEEALVAQTRYLAMVDGTISTEGQQAIDQATAIANSVRALKMEEAKSGRMISGAPASYWLDLRGYDPPADAIRVKAPMLILHGERDYQVTVTASSTSSMTSCLTVKSLSVATAHRV